MPEALGCRGWLTATVGTVAEWEAVLDRIDAYDGAADVEVLIPNEESEPLPVKVIDGGYKSPTPPVG